MALMALLSSASQAARFCAFARKTFLRAKRRRLVDLAPHLQLAPVERRYQHLRAALGAMYGWMLELGTSAEGAGVDTQRIQGHRADGVHWPQFLAFFSRRKMLRGALSVRDVAAARL